jgi:cell division protein FtsQ
MPRPRPRVRLRKKPRFLLLRSVMQWVFPWILMLILIFGAIRIWQLLQNPAYFPFRHLRILGEHTHTNPNQLSKVVSPYLRESFFSIKIRKLEDALLNFPWIADISFRKVWPDTLILQIKEQHAIAYFGNRQLMNEQGNLFSPPLATFPVGLPKLNGPVNSQIQVFEEYQQIQQMLAPLKLNISELVMDARQAWGMVLNNKITVVLGRRDIEGRLIRFIVLYPRVIGDRISQVESIDLRYENGVAIKWHTEKPKIEAKMTTSI